MREDQSDGSDPTQLLAGLRILTFEGYGAGPYGSMFLASLGAEVIKVETAASGGDATRTAGPHLLGAGDSHMFQSLNQNKRSVALDLKTEAGRDDFRKLVAGADAVMNNLRGDQPGKLGLDYVSLREINPQVVCLHISAYGRDTSRRAWPGYDFLMQAEAGLMSLSGEPEGPPTRLAVSMIDFMTGMTGAASLLAAILKAQRTGCGCDLDTNLFEVALHQLTYHAAWHLNAGDVPTRVKRGAHLALAPVQTFRTADGWMFVACMSDKFWEALIAGIGRPEFGTDPRFATMAARRTNRGALGEALEAIFETRPTAHWLGLLNGRLPIAPVNDLAQALADPLVGELGMVGPVPHPEDAGLRLLASPVRVNGRRPAQRPGAALGADTAELLGGADRPRSDQIEEKVA